MIAAVTRLQLLVFDGKATEQKCGPPLLNIRMPFSDLPNELDPNMKSRTRPR